MKVFLCDLIHDQVKGSNYISGSDDLAVPLNVASIAAYAKQMFDGYLETTIFKYPEHLLDALEESTPDVVAFSNYIWNQNLNLQIGSLLRETHPEVFTIMGGPSIPVDNKDIEGFLHKNPFLDVYIMYEGERGFVETLEAIQKYGREFLHRDIGLAGCAYLVDGEVVCHSNKLIEHIEEMPSPYLTGDLAPFLDLGFIPLFETNRGCPFHCTFCVWGIAAQSKIRQFPLDRVFAEMGHVADNYSHMPAWIIGDANFGILRRDVDIAQKLRSIRDRNPKLTTISIWESKNTTNRNLQIRKIIGSDMGDINGNVGYVLMAVQTLDPDAQVSVKRDNVHLDDIPRKIQAFHEAGAKVSTDVLAGLPDESFESQLMTIRKCFDLGYDNIQVSNTILLLGSEIETQVSRDEFQIRSRFHTRPGNYGEYSGIKSIECDEIIYETSVMSREEMASLRPIHWLIRYGWNQGFLKPLMRYAHRELGLNPIDLMVEMPKVDGASYPVIRKLFDDFNRDVEAELFDSAEELRAFFFKPENWKKLLNNGFSRIGPKYNAIMIADRNLFDAMVDLLVDVVKRHRASTLIDEIALALKEARIEPDWYFSGHIEEEKDLRLSPAGIHYVMDATTISDMNSGVLRLGKPRTDQELVRAYLDNSEYEKNKHFAIEKTLGVFPKAFIYDMMLPA